MSRSVRLSRRAPKRISDYNVGDIVEIHRNGNALRGRLAQLLTAGTSPNPRWLLKFDGQPQKDEEMYERSFGKLLRSHDEDETGATASSTSAGLAGQVSAQRKGRASGRKDGGTSSEGETGEETTKNETLNEETIDESNAGSDAEDSEIESKLSRARASAREQRSRRRQAKIDDDIIPGVNDALYVAEKRAGLPPSLQQHKRQRLDDGDVVKVKLLTGTLYLYRGKQRRAEFIRRV